MWPFFMSFDHSSETKKKSVGILGDGQLARMLAQSAAQKEVEVEVLSLDSDASASQLFPYFNGSSNDRSSLIAFAQRHSVILIENEFLEVSLLKDMVEKTQVTLIPNRDAIACAQDKGLQKKKWDELKIKTAPYFFLDDQPISLFLESLLKKHSFWVLKQTRMGYDGKGNFFLNRKTFFEAVAFCERAKTKSIPVFAEKGIDFSHEVSMVYVSSENEFFNFPLGLTYQEKGVCDSVLLPAIAFGMDPSLEEKAVEIGKKVSESLKMTGVFALEFFVDQGTLWVNEMAPRVHNTGHGTQLGFSYSQFDAHIDVAAGNQLQKPEQYCSTFMKNLLGPDEVSGDWSSWTPPAPPQGVFLNLYGKKEVRPRRKMGHLVVLVEDEFSVVEERVLQYETLFWNELRLFFKNKEKK
ncbi:MAG: hypothetical protein CL678_03335 [Bdellovibrionaceae bacterium]|nr:hypothetical protein [Pseudobdellovibrionaceae bacterium]|tara:strand:- start:2120 stop:3346 length:1227 start_codon:yes stop_codon:yes gene_type:complete